MGSLGQRGTFENALAGPAVRRQCLDGTGWSGWLVIERSRSAQNSRDVVWNSGANTRYLESAFQVK